MVLGKHPVPGRPTILITIGQGPTALAVGAGRDYLDIFTGDGRVVRWPWVNFQCQGVLLIWMIVGQGSIALAVGAGGGCLDIFNFLCPFPPFSPSLWETARYRVKYCLKGPLNPIQQQQHWTFVLSAILSLLCLSLSLWETARYSRKHCLKGPLNPNNQPTNQSFPLTS